MEFCDKVSAHVTMHSETRANLVRKIEKYPTVEDYKVALVEADEQELFYMKEVMYNLRNFYVSTNQQGVLSTGNFSALNNFKNMPNFKLNP